MFGERDYFWVVLCKNHRFHHIGNPSYLHQIAIGETDAHSPLPVLTERVIVRCDNCGEQFSYKPTEILRNVVEIPAGFVPHPLFRQSPSPGAIQASRAQNTRDIGSATSMNLISKHPYSA